MEGLIDLEIIIMVAVCLSALINAFFVYCLAERLDKIIKLLTPKKDRCKTKHYISDSKGNVLANANMCCDTKDCNKCPMFKE